MGCEMLLLLNDVRLLNLLSESLDVEEPRRAELYCNHQNE